jgi:dethiobiotin synthetase
VVGSRLGVINHSLLTFEVLKARGIPTLGYVFNDMFKASLADQSISSNRQVLAREAKKYGFGEVAYLPFDEAQASDRADFQGLLAKLSKGNICQ